MNGIYARESPRLDRAVQLGIASGRVISVEFPRSVPDDAAQSHDLLDRVFDYLDGAEDDFDDVLVALTVPTETRRVLETVRRVPYGETASLSRIARTAGFDPDEPDDLELVSEALGENPVPIFVPDHRVDGGHGATPAAVAEALRELERR